MKDHTQIVVVLDRSGSMSVVRDDTIGGFNTFLEDQKKAGNNASLTLIQFDDQYEVNYENKPIAEVEPLTQTTYQPRGSTALLDAMGRAITTTGDYLAGLAESERPDKVIVVILTDGQENASREFTREKVFEMVQHQTDKYNWVFTYLGANQDAIQVGGWLGMAAANCASFSTENRQAYNATFNNLSAAVSGLRSTGFYSGYDENMRDQMMNGNKQDS